MLIGWCLFDAFRRRVSLKIVLTVLGLGKLESENTSIGFVKLWGLGLLSGSPDYDW